MCGIAGFIDRSLPIAEARSLLGRMLARIVHRGPDGEGVHFAPDRGVAVGMRRLSIIDVDGGSQPIWNEDRSIGVVFNGEIYNFVELRETLEAKGHSFRTHTDTEVLVHLYEEHGEAMLSRLRGMFAFAILDCRKDALFLARDHFGQKPLYFTTAGECFAFASELKALLELPWMSRELEPEAFAAYASWLSLPPPRTHFKGVRKLQAGHCLTIPLGARGDGNPAPRKYWSYDLSKPPELENPEAAIDQLDAALRDSIKLHLRADVPVGVLLSSGLDSRIVTAYAHGMQSGGMQTFTIGVGGSESEAEDAAQTAREIGSTHRTLEIDERDFSGTLAKVAWHLDEPVGDPAAFAVLKICELAREHVKVLLSGEGADELFAGYDGRYAGMLDTLSRSDRLRRLAPVLPRFDAGAHPSRWNRLRARAHSTPGEEAIALRIEGLPGDIRHPRGLSASQLRALRLCVGSTARSLYRRQRDRLSELLTLDLEWQLPESLLQKADKMSMAAAIELRTPLLDLRVGEVAARIPSRLKLPPSGPGKLILRQCLARKLNEPLSRPKRGFPVPLAAWFRGPLRAELEETLWSGNASWRAHLDPHLVRAAWTDFQSGAWDGSRVFYALWLYEVWIKQFAL